MGRVCTTKFTQSKVYLHPPTSCLALLRIFIAYQVLDAVHQAVQKPLRIHLGLTAQHEPVQPIAVTQVYKHRLQGGHALPA